jgi:hypothetical protein
MSSDAQAIWFFGAVLGCLLAAFWAYAEPAHRRPFTLVHFHPGWLGLACFCFVFFWQAVKAS